MVIYVKFCLKNKIYSIIATDKKVIKPIVLNLKLKRNLVGVKRQHPKIQKAENSIYLSQKYYQEFIRLLPIKLIK